MIFKLLRFKTKGIKNIDKDMTVYFSDQSVNKNGDIGKFARVKSIYGLNGAGKSALITAIDLYSHIARERMLLNNPIVVNEIEQLLNYHSYEIYLEATFSVSDDKTNIYRHTIVLHNWFNEGWKIEKETIGIIRDKVISGNYESLISINEGIIDHITAKETNQNKKDLIDFTHNLLHDSSIVSIVCSHFHNFFNKGNLFNILNHFYCFANYIFVLNDGHHWFDVNEKATNFELYQQANNFVSMYGVKENIRFVENDLIPLENIDHFKSCVNDLTKFIKYFKPKLDTIDLDLRRDDDNYLVNLIFKYGEDEVDLSNESKGTKYLVELYYALKQYSCGRIVFVDDIDSNVSAQYLTDLIDVLLNNGNGQLTFSAHDYDLMNPLKNVTHGITFINNDGVATDWVRSGNYNPGAQYRTSLVSEDHKQELINLFKDPINLC